MKEYMKNTCPTFETELKMEKESLEILLDLININKNFFTGINLHHFPVGFREEWFRSILAGRKVILPKFITDILPIFKQAIPDNLKKIPYEQQASMMKWIKTGVRNYNILVSSTAANVFF